MPVGNVAILCRNVVNLPTASSIPDFEPRPSFELYFRKKASVVFSLDTGRTPEEGQIRNH